MTYSKALLRDVNHNLPTTGVFPRHRCISGWGRQADIIYLDFPEVVDSVIHRHLVAQLTSFGINSSLLSWMTAYLDGYKQCVVVEGESSY